MKDPRPGEKKSRVEDPEFVAQVRNFFADSVEDFCTDPKANNGALDINACEKIRQGKKIDGHPNFKAIWDKVAKEAGLSDKEKVALSEKFISPFFVMDPKNDKNFMMGFDDRDVSIFVPTAKTSAIQTVLEKHQLRPFPQIPWSAKDGFAAWEIWGVEKAEMSRERMEEIRDEVEVEMNRVLEFFRKGKA